MHYARNPFFCLLRALSELRGLKKRSLCILNEVAISSVIDN